MVTKYIKIITPFLLVGLIISTYIVHKNNNSLREELSVAMMNQKVAVLENNSLKEENRVYKYTVEQLSYYNDSILHKMDSIRHRLDVKNNELVSMQYLQSKAVKRDTIYFNDTVFCNNIMLDTLIRDNWYSIELELQHPNIIYIQPSFTSEKFIITSKKRETINPPKKFFLLRWFQKKHWVMEVTVKDMNPYIKETNNKFIEIIE